MSRIKGIGHEQKTIKYRSVAGGSRDERLRVHEWR